MKSQPHAQREREQTITTMPHSNIIIVAPNTLPLLSYPERLKLAIFTKKFKQRFNPDIFITIRKQLSDLGLCFTQKNIAGMKAIMRPTKGISIPAEDIQELTLEMTIDRSMLMCNNGFGLQISVNMATVLQKNRANPHETWRILASDVVCKMPNGDAVACYGYVRPFDGNLWLFFNNPKKKKDEGKVPCFWFMITKAKKRMLWPRLMACSDHDVCGGLGDTRVKLLTCADCDACGLELV
jgi:hypothetical protein